MRRHHRRGRALRRRYGRAGRGGVVDQHMVEELDLYAENESALYNQKKSILANIARRVKKGAYDHSKAPKLWGYWVTAAAKKYQHDSPGVVFNKATRDALAVELADRYRSGEE
jgi:hypothetical protein